MQKQQANAPKGGIGVQDIIIGLFKHKWMILILTLVGLGAAAVVYKKRVPIYQSQAKLLVEYVIKRGAEGASDVVEMPGKGGRWGDPVINTEIEILNSVDLAYDVAEEFGVERLVPEAAAEGGTVDPSAAAGVVLEGMAVNPGHSSNVVYVNFGHKDKELAREVLAEIIEQYLRRHIETHRSKSRFEAVAVETAKLKNSLREVKFKLDQLRMKSGIMTLADATEALTTLRGKTREDLMHAKADLAELMAELGPDGDDPEEDDVKEDTDVREIPQRVLAEYQSLNEIIEMLRKRDVELQLKFKSGNPLMTRNRAEIDKRERRRQQLLAEYPELKEEELVSADRGSPRQSPRQSLKARVATCKAKIRLFESQLEEIGEQFRREYQIGAQIDELEREREALEEQYRASEADLKNAKRDAELDPTRMPNITILQKPSDPVKTYDEKVQMIVMGLAGGGLALGVGLALLIELLIDRRVKRPAEIQTRLQLPLLLTIPFIRKHERGGLLLSHRKEETPLLAGGENAEDGGGHELSDSVSRPVAGKGGGHFILPFAETIRDRIIFNFEINNITHKPKLLAVTGLSEGAGASTIAAGLAKSFSDIQGMKVLLVDLSSCSPEQSPLFGELPGHSLNGALRLASSDNFRKSEQNLYLANAPARRDETGISTFSPMHLYELMPSLLKSDYDYIIFDMPPVDQTSRTMTMAGMMDKVLLVLDADNTSRDRLQWGFSELVKGKADVSCVFNKTKSHVPGWLLGSN